MGNIENAILECYKDLIKEKNLEITPDLNNVVGRESGLDSLGIVGFIVNIEDRLDISLDPVLAQIRQSKTLNDIVKIVEALILK
jgi:acyl carrier protein